MLSESDEVELSAKIAPHGCLVHGKAQFAIFL
jgi:hypothetical protein